MPTEEIDAEKLIRALRACLPLGDDESDVTEYIAHDVSQEIEAMPSQADLAEMTLGDLEDLPVFGLLSSHLTDLLGDVPSPLLVSSILDAYWAPEPLDDESSSGPPSRECELCDRRMPLTDHHLLPRNEHARLVKRELYTLEECRTRIAKLCRPCHSAVHRAADTRQLADSYNSIEMLLTLENVAKFAAFASKQRPNSTGNRHGLKHAR